MLARLAAFSVRRRRLVLVLALIGFGASGAWGGSVAGELTSGGFDDGSQRYAEGKSGHTEPLVRGHVSL